MLALALLLCAGAPAWAASGELYALGSNLYGQLGNEVNAESTNANPTAALVALPGASGPVSELAAGENHSLAVTSAGQLYAFGDNQFGELGIAANSGTQNANPTPALVALPGATGPVTQVAAGANHSLAVTSTGQLYAFGLNRFGQLGNTTRNGTEKPNPTPTLVTLPGASGPVVQVAAGANDSFAVTSTGQLYSFGENNRGQLGTKTNSGATKANPTPALVTLPGAIGQVTQVAAGEDFTLVVTSSGQLFAFGDNYYGQLGSTTNNEVVAANPTPALVTLPQENGGVTEAAADSNHSLAVTSSGQLYAFGDNDYGQLGNATNNGKQSADPTPTPVTLPGASGSPIQVAAGHNDSLAVTSGGQLYAFGENGFGEIGNALTAETEQPNPTPEPVALPTGARAISVARGADSYHTLALVIPEGGAAPAVQTDAASSIGRRSATLQGSVNPDGGAVSECSFEYGTSSAYGQSVPCAALPGGGEEAAAVSATPAGLTPGTTYHFRTRATNPGGTSYGPDETFTTQVQPPPSVNTSAPSSIRESSATLNGSVDPDGAEVSECRFEYGTSKLYGLAVPCTTAPGSGESPVVTSGQLTGLVNDTTYHYRLVATNEGGTSYSAEATFTTSPPPPTVTTGAASSVTRAAASLTGTVNPNGSDVGECRFEYGTSTSFGSSVACSALPGDGEEAVGVGAELQRLRPDTTYYFRLVAANPGGTSVGAIQSLKTEPLPPSTVTTGAASSVAKRSATLNGTVNPNGVSVGACFFEYGTSTSYGSTVACESLPGEGDSAVAVSAPLSGLTPGTTYYFRLVATDEGGTSVAEVQSLTTPPLLAPTTTTGAATMVAKSSATLTGTVDPNDEPVEACYFEYGTSTSYGSTVACESLPGDGDRAVPVSAPIAGLNPATTYYFRLLASGPGGSAPGAAQSFTTPALRLPALGTEPASRISNHAATLNATVNPVGLPVTECRFEYGNTTAYGSSVPCSSSPGSGENPVAVSASITGLTQEKAYHFRIVASNAEGTRYGLDEEFATLGPPQFGRCLKVAGEAMGKKAVYDGAFKSATCSTASPSNTGKYEFYPGVERDRFQIALKKEDGAKLEPSRGVRVICRTESGVGEYRETNEVAALTIGFTGCETATSKGQASQQCKTPGLAPGQLQTKTLEGTLAWEGQGEKHVVLDLYAAGKSGPLLQYSCGSKVTVSASGSLVVPLKVDKMLTVAPLKFKPLKTREQLEMPGSGAEQGLGAPLIEAAEEGVGLNASATLTSEEPVEVDAVA